jgi:golgi-specific brefeldin A-resistance guanine nucleotide exchange factor 1
MVHITTEALRRSAELTMHKLVRTVLSKLYILDPMSEEKRLSSDLSTPATGTFPSSSTQSVEPVSDDPPAVTQPVTPTVQSHQDAFATQKLDCVLLLRLPFSLPDVDGISDGLPSIVELLRVLVNLLDPHDRVHTDSTRLLALSVLNTSLEVSGTRLGEFPSLRTMVLDHGCKYLFQLAQSENSSVFQLTLRTISTMMNTMRRHLKLQQELFLAYTLDRLAPPMTGKPSRLGTPVHRGGLFSPRPSSPSSHTSSLELLDEADVEKGSPTPNKPSVIPARGSARDLLLDVLSQISGHPSFLVELFSNYDCDTNAENLFERVIDVLTKVHPAPASLIPCSLILSFRVYTPITTGNHRNFRT